MKFHNAIFIEIKNAIAANDVATRTDLLKSRKIETEEISALMNVIVDDKIILNKFKTKRSS